MDVATLADLLHETADHHDHYEKTHPPHDWWDWYAPYLNAREQGSTAEEAAKAAGALHGKGSRRGCPMTASELGINAPRFPSPTEGIVLAHFIVSDDVERSRRFYTEVLGGELSLSCEGSVTKSMPKSAKGASVTGPIT